MVKIASMSLGEVLTFLCFWNALGLSLMALAALLQSK